MKWFRISLSVCVPTRSFEVFLERRVCWLNGLGASIVQFELLKTSLEEEVKHEIYKLTSVAILWLTLEFEIV